MQRRKEEDVIGQPHHLMVADGWGYPLLLLWDLRGYFPLFSARYIGLEMINLFFGFDSLHFPLPGAGILLIE